MNISEQLRTEQINATEASQVLENPMFKKARVHVEESLAQARLQVPIRDTQMHTQLIQMEQQWHRLMDFLEQSLVTGKLANLQIHKEATRLERVQAQMATYFRR